MSDIREYKKNLRNEIKRFRKNMPKELKQNYDNKISDIFLSSSTYKLSDMVLSYVSTDIEVDTMKIILKAFEDKKIVAVPRCIKNSRKMEFIVINSLNDLEKGSFGVLEPKLTIVKKANPTNKSVCIIPALSYDKFGYRLGYGGGYYDRFLSNFKGNKVGIIYNENITEQLIHGKFDIPVTQIVSQTKIKKVQ